VLSAQKADIDWYRAQQAEINGEERTDAEAEQLRREALIELGRRFDVTQKRVKRDAKRRRRNGL
jgi:hypothetical protein